MIIIILIITTLLIAAAALIAGFCGIKKIEKEFRDLDMDADNHQKKISKILDKDTAAMAHVAFGFVLVLFGVFGGLVSGFMIISECNAQRANEIRNETTQRITYLNAKKEYFEEYGSKDSFANYYYRFEFDEYNSEVESFKHDLGHHQDLRNSMWTNWFVSDAWNEFSVDDVSYINVNDYAGSTK